MKKAINLSTYIIICMLFISCASHEELVIKNNEQQLAASSKFYDLFSQNLTSTIDACYKKISISDSFESIDQKIKSASIDFLNQKGYNIEENILTDNIECINNLSDNELWIIEQVKQILQIPDYNIVRNDLSELYEKVQYSIPQAEQQNLILYIKHVEKTLDILENNSGHMDVLIFLSKNSMAGQPEKLMTRTESIKIEGLADGIYPHPTDRGKYLMAWQGYAYVITCSNGLIFDCGCQCCNWPDGGGSSGCNNSWWTSWGKCAAAILGGAGTGGLGGAAVGSAVPGLGTLAGAIAGAISGAFTGAVAGC